ncbi:hypothetical protein [Verrucomicrobium spinosum]|nr:hypothetical protein [Verrucomicrobium spinosum]
MGGWRISSPPTYANTWRLPDSYYHELQALQARKKEETLHAAEVYLW